MKELGFLATTKVSLPLRMKFQLLNAPGKLIFDSMSNGVYFD